MRVARVIAAAVLAASSWAAVPLAQSAASAERWEPVTFLVGSWSGEAKGRPGSGTSVREYTRVMDERFIEVRNRSTYPPQPENAKGEEHEDRGYISYDESRRTFVLRQFHVEGFVNTYAATVVEPGHLVFTSEAIENIPPGWRARETYRRMSADQFVETFELAEPGKDFEVYTETRFARVIK